VAGHGLLQAGLSTRGYLKASGIMHLDEILAERLRARRGRGDRRLPFGQRYYWLNVFGDPAGQGPWGWQLDGHHLALNYTVVGDRVSVTPAFLGADPAEVREGVYSGYRPLAKEDDLGLALMRSLDAGQRARAVLGEEVPRDVFSGPGRADALKEPEGLSFSEMTEAQGELVSAQLRA